MLKRLLQASVLLVSLLATPVYATYTIDNDGGGVISDYQEKFTMLRRANEKVVIDGPCISACTLVLALVPKENVCITPRAIFGFHSASDEEPLQPKRFSPDGTGLVWYQYPKPIRAWLVKQGWDGKSAHDDVIWMDNDDAGDFLKRCEQERETQ